jgi:radical SAM superfamily enzyme YgiQ (UPF0313 family)
MPDRSLYPGNDFGIRSYLVSSRGCGYRCTFCFESSDRKLRSHSPTRVIEEIQALREQYGSNYICFVDDVFTSDHRRVRDICAAMGEAFQPHEDFFWYCEGRVDNLVRQPDLLPLMTRAGLTRIQIGTESGSQAVIDKYKKQIDITQIKEAVELCRENDVMSIYTNFILGGALESFKTFDQTVDMTVDLIKAAPGRMDISGNFLSPYPGTDIFNRPEEYSIRPLEKVNKNETHFQFKTGLSDSYIFVETEELNKQQILDLYWEFNKVLKTEMANIAPKIPKSLMKRQLLMRKNGLTTYWSDYLLSDNTLKAWLRFLNSQGYTSDQEGFHGVEDASVFPVRTIDLRSLKAGKYAWPLLNLAIEFSKLELILVELASGKNSIDDILHIIKSKFNYKGEFEKLRDDILGFYKQLDENFLVVYKIMQC